ncbi:MAG: response regulator transcription factor [Bacteroidia bacterium]|jgi:DNA-binding NarL/FixJ family response regulator|nr:response regulator transcription factor [Bacteroidia bacterium]
MSHRSVVIVDDHKLFSSALAELIGRFERYEVLYQVHSGRDLLDRFASPRNIPDVVLLDINMPGMDGFETAARLREKHEDVKVLAVSMHNDEESVVRMIRAGARGYVLKDAQPDELRTALDILCDRGVYYSEMVTSHLVNAITHDRTPEAIAREKGLTPRELEFLKLACSELTYKEIADRMNLSIRTVDGHREALFDKLEVRSRVGLVLYAISHRIVML